MLELEEARRRLFAAIPKLAAETIPLRNASQRVLAEDVVSALDLPAFDNSAMDGYALRAADVAPATAGSPVPLQITGRAAAGDNFKGRVEAGSCIRVFTGSILPAGAEAVVMQEDTRPDPNDSDRVFVLDPARPWENVRFRGEDVKRGATIIRAGERLTVGRLGLLAATGCGEVKVIRRPVIGLLATGSELLEPGASLAPGKIYESNRAALEPLVSRSGAVAKVFPLVPDSLDATRRALEEAFVQCDAVVTSGGVSVGEMDFVKAAFESLGGRLDFWRVAIKPGKPFVFGQWNGKFLFGLPGNPVSAIVTFQLLVRPALWHWQGASSVEPVSVPAVLAEALANPGDRRHFMRVRMDEHGVVRSAGAQASHRLGSLAEANALADVPPRTTLPVGASVRIILLDD